MKKLFKFLVAVFMGLALTSCGDIVIQPILNSVELNKEAVTLEVGQTETLEATIKPELLDVEQTTITWTTSNNEVASVNDSGLVTALKEGTATIKVTVTSGRFTKEDTCLVTVVQPVSGVTLDKTSASLKVGENVKLTPTILPNNATNKSVTWSTSDANVATVNDGLVSAIKAGNVTITVTTKDGNKNATCTITVIQPVTGVVLDKQAHTLNVGEDFTLTATVNPNDAENKEVTWSSSNAAVATVNNGKVSAIKAGTATITVKTADGNKEASCVVTVLQPVTGIELDAEELALVVGEDTTLVATVLPSDASNKAVTWTSNNTAVATVNAEGKVIAVGPGSAVITATTVDGNKTSTCTVTVTQLVSGVTLNKTEATLYVDEILDLIATVSPANATNKAVTWSSSNPQVATVNENGYVVIVGQGSATITVTTVDGNKQASCVITAIQGVEEVKLPATLTIVEGNTAKLTPTVLPTNATNKAVTWSSSNLQVATVDEEGNVTPVGLGTTVITVTTVDRSKTASCTVTVVEFTLPATGVVIEGDKNTLVIEETLLLEAVVTPTNSTDTVTWSSSNANVATVGQNGLVTALTAGTTTIKVKVGTVEATYDITVNKNTVVVSGFEDKVVTYGSNYEFIYTVSSNQTVSLEYYKGETKLAAKPTNAGEYNVKLTLAENDKYNAFTKTVKLTINKKEVNEPTISGTYTYNGSEQTVTVSGLESYMSVAGNKGTNAGNYEVIITLDDNHKWAEGNDGVIAWSIAKAEPSLSVEDLEVELGGEIEVNYETSSDGQVTIKFYQNDLEVTPDAAGEYKVVVTVAEGTNYKKAEANATLTIIISATGVELSKESTTINVGENETIEITVSPADTTDSVVITSTDEAVATMDQNGKIVAKTKVGTATITVTCGDYSDSIVVTVVSPWGSEEEPISVEKALELTKALGNWGYSKVPGYMIGVVVDDGYNTQYKNYTMIVSDEKDPSKTYTFYRGVDTDPSDESIVSVGDVVVLYGYYCYYGSTNPTPEMTKYNNVTPTIISVAKPTFDIELSVKDTNGNDTTSVTVVDLEEKAEVNATVEFTIENEQNYILIVTVNDVELTPVEGTYSFTLTEAASVKVIVVEGEVNAESITIEGATTVELDQKTLTLVGSTEPYYATETKTWTSSDETIATVENGVVTLLKAGTVTITVKTGTTNKEDTHDITITNRWGSENAPISVETALSLIDTLDDGVYSIKGYVTGVVSSKPTTNSRGNYIFEIVNTDTLTSTKVFKVYSGVSPTAPQVGDVVVVSGYFVYAYSTYEVTYSGSNDCVIESITHKEYSYTVEYLDTEDAAFEGAEVVGLDSTLTSGAEEVFTVNVPQGYEVNKVKFNGVTITPNANGEYTIVAALENVITVVVAAEGNTPVEPSEPAWTLVTDASNLAVGDQIVIVATGANYALSTNQKSNNRGQAEVVKDDETITFDADVQVLTLEAGTQANTFAFNTGSGYLYAASSSSNHLKTETNLSDNSSWSITIADGVATIKAQGTNTRNWLRHNSSSSLFSCYGSGQNDVSIYKYLTNSGNEETPTCEHANTTTTTVNATCTQKGSITVTCDDCSEVVSTEEIPMISHVDVNTDEDHNCDVCGATNVTEHVYVEGVCNCGDEEETQEPELVTRTVSTTIADYASANSWENGIVYNTILMDGNVTVTAIHTTSSNNPNTAKYYTNGTNWRIYQNEAPKITITAGNRKIISVKFVYVIKNTGILTLNGQNVESNTAAEVNASSVELGVGNTTAETTNGNIQITSIEIVVESSAAELACEHTNAETTTVEATCTKEGKTIVRCNECYTTISSTKIPVIPHKDVDTDEDHNCDVCGATNVTAHDYVDGVCNCGEEEQSGEPETPAVLNAQLSFADKAQRTSYSAAQQVWEQNGVKFTNNKSSSTNDVADYAKPVRLYANSEVIIEAAGIKTIVFDCNSEKYATALQGSIGTGSGATVTISSDIVTVTFANAVDSFTIAKLTAQVRIDSITVNP